MPIPFFCDYGTNKRVFFNFNYVMLDVARMYNP
jgi:hypothetical protein